MGSFMVTKVEYIYVYEHLQFGLKLFHFYNLHIILEKYIIKYQKLNSYIAFRYFLIISSFKSNVK